MNVSPSPNETEKTRKLVCEFCEEMLNDVGYTLDEVQRLESLSIGVQMELEEEEMEL